ncbi:50S ribosomal protein L13 [Candidatus Kaiserbacteria bacterium CG10_big_fil_rev_8_21_14_0_10_44_10]|uniref:50S ribosomal protein L13 n=1 Tax=Candidatus Kaiserbacteria bacterium CG10_big_fil_rev_8_21_14_0_10_44_10 TaxID=1974606 RepID=A0A2H0UH70_9BACT|nr:MAG: 50S ribosomal protein L13 [Candidatus Kaiserbacteria bacterium CG10_big_fil_rev_8_21_14_0_10_44_10]
METENNKKEYVIDATGKRLGRIATEAASVLIGKDSPDFAKNMIADVTVKIENASKMDILESKKKDTYQSYSGYPGGLRSETLDHLGNRLGYAEVLRRTISGMLPKNKLRKPTLHNLVISE